MGFFCPSCRSAHGLEIRQSIALPPDSRSDEIMVQVLACRECKYEAAAVYEESRRGELGSEAWNHTGYRASHAALWRLMNLISACPTPKMAGCQCASHRRLGRRSQRGTWNALDDFDLGAPFGLVWDDTRPTDLPADCHPGSHEEEE